MFRHMNNDQASSAIWLICGASICIASLKYGLGTLVNPGTGFTPFLAGSAIFLFSSIGLVRATLEQKKGLGWKSPIRGLAWGKSFIVLAALFSYTLAVIPLGFSLSTALFIGFLLRAARPQRWSVVIIGSFSTAFAAYLIFEVLLGAQLPKGPWGF